MAPCLWAASPAGCVCCCLHTLQHAYSKVVSLSCSWPRSAPHHHLRPLLLSLCRTAALVTNAVVAQRGGDDSNARVMLTKALKTAHAHLGNTQMVAQVGRRSSLVSVCLPLLYV